MPEVRLIDSDTLRFRIGELCMNNEDMFPVNAYKRIIGVIEAIPTIAAAPVRHGRWIDNGEDKYICSACNGYMSRWFGKRDFCPNCGADMRGGAEDDR